ncbi:hypothetical protein LCGC14_0542350 [marine sediment metagenome]|uniref:Uncharacterized protein n=1 Tax=marine sediment metagenome TaxID=412755 RepID=A0A0F9RSH2_9ZZZZ
MCEELNNELDQGRTVAKTLCEHLDRMGAQSLKIPLTLNGREYSVQVSWKPETKIKPLTDTEICEKQCITFVELELKRETAKELNATLAERACGITREEYDKLPKIPIEVCSDCGTVQEAV